MEEQLTHLFQISRAPLREALRLLAEQGLVEHLPRRGVRVTSYSERDFDELFAVRNVLERFAVSLVQERTADELDTEPLEQAMGGLRGAAEEGDRLAASNAHRAFHLALVALADSRQLVATYEPLILKLQLPQDIAGRGDRDPALCTPQDERPPRWGSAVWTGRVSDCRPSAVGWGAAANVGDTARRASRAGACQRVGAYMCLFCSSGSGRRSAWRGASDPVRDRPRGLLERDACGSVSRTRATAPR